MGQAGWKELIELERTSWQEPRYQAIRPNCRVVELDNRVPSRKVKLKEMLKYVFDTVSLKHICPLTLRLR